MRGLLRKLYDKVRPFFSIDQTHSFCYRAMKDGGFADSSGCGGTVCGCNYYDYIHLTDICLDCPYLHCNH